jgi:hypothetical protein
MYSRPKLAKSLILLAAVVLSCVPTQLHAQVTLLLEEPYSYDGTFAGTGHSAVYLSRVCAESPTLLRRCGPGEPGVVLSRYNRVGGLDWIAIPLIPYLYAVNSAENVPLFADTKLVAFLRHEYLQNIAAELDDNADERRDSWNQLAGSAYNRTLYGFRIATRPEQDDELIRTLNSSPNREAYRLLNRNCADFVQQIINFYYPKAIHRSIIADLGVMTPKQAAKSLVHSARRHREMQLTTFIIPQVPGLKRSKPVHGVLESLVLAKKYVTPVLLFHPFLVGTVEVAYWAGWRFNPAKGALIFDPATGLEMPLTDAQRRAYESSVSALKRDIEEAESTPDWRKLAASAEPQLDAAGQPFLRIQMDGRTVHVGLCRGNALRLTAPPELVQELLLTRLEHELKSRKPSRASEQQIKTDWKMLQGAVEARQAALAREQ